MTQNPSELINPQIPELLDRLEGRVASPNPKAIRSEARRRSSRRKRALNTVGGIVLLAGVAGGALALNRDSSTTTETAAQSSESFAVADTSSETEGVPSTPLPPLSTTLPQASPAAPTDSFDEARLSIEANIDGVAGTERIWLERDGTLHAGEFVITVDLWEISDYWFEEQAGLSTEIFDSQTTAILLTWPTQEEEDPSNAVHVILVEDQGLNLVFAEVVGVYGPQPLTFGGDGSVSYVEDGWTACRHADESAMANRQQIILTMGADGQLIETSRQDTANPLQDCTRLAG